MSEPKPAPPPDGLGPRDLSPAEPGFTAAPMNTDAPVVPTGGDSVSDMHRAHMTQMNDPVMLTADGVDDDAVEEPGAGGSDDRN